MRSFDECQDDAFWADPAAAFQRLFEAGERVLKAPDGSICLFGYGYLTAFARHPAIDGPAVPEQGHGMPEAVAEFFRAGLFAQSGETHRWQRRAALAGLGTASVVGRPDEIDGIVRDCLDRIAPDVPIDLARDLVRPIAARVWTMFVDYPPRTAETLDACAEVLADPTSPHHLQVDAARKVAEMTAETRGDGSAFIDAIEGADPERGFDAPPLVASMIVDGIDSATAGIAGALSVLAEQPPLALRPFGHERCLEEALRLWMPVILSMRQAAQDVVVEGVEVPQGTVLWMWWGAGCRDPGAYPEPGSFRPDRRGPLAPVFGAGRHACLGHALVRTTALALLQALADRECSLVACCAATPCPPWRLARIPHRQVRLERLPRRGALRPA